MPRVAPGEYHRQMRRRHVPLSDHKESSRAASDESEKEEKGESVGGSLRNSRSSGFMRRPRMKGEKKKRSG